MPIQSEADPTELAEDEIHPVAGNCLEYIRAIPPEMLDRYRRTFALEAKDGNRLAQVCEGTLNRLLSKQPVSDRYLMGLAWTLRDLVMLSHMQPEPEPKPESNE